MFGENEEHKAVVNEKIEQRERRDHSNFSENADYDAVYVDQAPETPEPDKQQGQ
ncbi:hypothetical protein [Megasphaera sp. UBA4382]|uniref:hypothetical protein n=1 Tax=Megasphaera sp. UBA4382 TaxID=1946850 RepID=UPI0025C2FC80|nr:hypothetical protein [Megasphaera sp. UBA4382]